QITAQYPIRCTFVRDDAGDHLIDPHGVLLPQTDPLGSHTDCIVLASPHFARPARPGQLWEGADIAAGISLLKVIYSKPWAKQIREIDLSAYNRDNSLALITDKSSMILWGASPGDAAPLEATTSEKLHRLDLLFQTYRRIDANLSGTLDITPQDGVFKLPDTTPNEPPARP
ncbi:MAG TPA: hypothetical protein VG711_09185, partial [Phycisphaerales bacterium]|nr:hypothetical protein [Phycisphaerales bacterium]